MDLREVRHAGVFVLKPIKPNMPRGLFLPQSYDLTLREMWKNHLKFWRLLIFKDFQDYRNLTGTNLH